MRAILMVGHGSRDSEGNDQVRSFIDQIKTQVDPDLLVETCFLEFERPDVHQGIKNCVLKGATSVAVVPIMLLPAGHSKIHIPAAIDEAKEQYPHVDITYSRPIGIHDSALKILQYRLEEIGEDTESPTDDTAVLLLGRGGSDPDANSDLYKITRLLWEKLNYQIIEPAFMGVTHPSLDEGIERLVKLGAKRVIILPYFLFTGILINRLEDSLAKFKEQYPEHSFLLAKYFGFHPELQRILIDRIEEVLQGEVKMNCDTCQYRLDAMAHIDHHHHHDHDHHHHHYSHENEEQKV
ncbi:sirohydrochlorin chelatase [Fictibacillus barbaricus]|uniref:Sirohydrochlorin chelatase n=1 Tax=Fictibacillus barbaricus TaxID=182136 RepID=A0ABS2ZC15_9BACL|nr:sirohydrochlorin chelatase [Fictibacillus barbaricus]MBN3545475.1 sirohydrochlorin chelatase [Fictibacillus barbaricus]GGB53708.1 cobalamin biosynthesis protein CbiX [Fictibacillus barbaricus]